MSYDVKCEVLAKLFLSDEFTDEKQLAKHIPKLAQDIQDTIEGYIDGVRHLEILRKV